eukprot:1934834-Rhodomonas_salina.9
MRSPDTTRTVVRGVSRISRRERPGHAFPEMYSLQYQPPVPLVSACTSARAVQKTARCPAGPAVA